LADETKESFPTFKIFETINLNRGLNVKLFTDLEKAIRWVKNQ
jgi:hypothetical protein